ncbi:hypothetical protein M2146_002500 [Lachnospiraceae bacterium PF1-22]
MKFKKFALIAVAIIAFIITFTIPKTSFIIWFGIAMTNILFIAVRVLSLLVVGVAIFLLIRSQKEVSAHKKKESVRNIKVNTNSDYDQDYIANLLSLKKEEIEGLEKELDCLQGQMASMDRKQDKIREILERNQTKSLQSVENTLINVEQVIFSNIIKILNRADLWDNEEYHLESKREIYVEHRTRIKKLIDVNDNLLNKTDELLSETIKYLNAKDGDNVGSSQLETMLSTIQSLTNKGEE